MFYCKRCVPCRGNFLRNMNFSSAPPSYAFLLIVFLSFSEVQNNLLLASQYSTALVFRQNDNSIACYML